MIVRKLSKKLIAPLWLMSAVFISAHAEENTPPDLNAKIGRWVEDGPAIKEFPVCYQLWKCENSQPTAGESILLPKGEWGLCSNYAEVSDNQVCTQCAAPPPLEVCE